MRRFFSLFTMMMLCSVLSFAQGRVVSGTVTDATGKAVSFATVLVKGNAGTGTQADVNGNYSIRINPGDVLVFSGTGFQNFETSVGSLSTVNVTLTRNANELTEVIVTSAFNTKRVARSVSSNTQNVTSEQLNTVRASNINNALAGKVANAQVRSQSAVSLGRETNIRLRGENGLGVGGGPVYVIDGTIMPSANDINPDDIEDLSILQGPSAAALFGPQGKDGAIVINTKRAKKGQSGLGIEVNTGVTFDRVYIVPNHQNAYAGGGVADLLTYTWEPGQPEAWKALDGKKYHDYTDDASWGPRMIGQEYIPWYAWYAGHERSFQTAALTPQSNNIRDFYNTGVTLTNNVSFSKATDNSNIRVSYTNLDVKGLIPESYLKRNTLNTNFSIDLHPKLTLSASINYIRQDRQAENNDQYSNASTGSFNQWFHRDLDINILRELRDLKTPEGVYASWNHSNPYDYNADDILSSLGANYWFNPYTYFKFARNYDTRERVFGDVTLNYKISNSFRLRGTYRKQQLTTDVKRIYPTEMQMSAYQAGFNPFPGADNGTNLAAYGVSNSYSNRQNYELIGSYNKKIRDFSVNADAGLVILKTIARGSNQNTRGGLNVPFLYSLANSKETPNVGQAYEDYTQRGVFVRADFGYKNLVFVDGTFRKDYTSAEPTGKPINTKSVGASFVFSDLIKNKGILSYGKIRASMGEILDALPPYSLNALYAVGQDQFSGNFTMNEPDVLIDPNLRGSKNQEKEIGIETRFLKNRLGLTVTYWDRKNKDFPVTIATNQATGYTGLRTNGGEISKQGIDIQFFANPVRKANFDWTFTAAFGRIFKNTVVSIAPGITRLVVASGAFSGTSSGYTVNEVGKQWGMMFGGGIKRDEAGLPILKADGTYIKEDNVNFGSVLPKYTGGFQNTFTVFKDFSININIDYQYGGKFYSLSDAWGTVSGLTARTAALNDKGNSVRDAPEDGGGVHVIGVDEAGKAMDVYVDAFTYFHQFRSKNIAEAHIYDLSFVKLREMSVGYRLPVNKMGINKFVKNATFSIIARNPLLLWSKTRDFDPSEISQVQGEDGQQPGTRSLGVNLKIGF